ncbi:hypothetical protein Bca101_076226 [Brassica carinata]
MSDEEHHFESSDAGASKTYPQQAGNIRKGGHIVIKGRPCKVVEVSTSKTGKHGHAKCHFVAIDIFTAKKLEDIVPSSHNCDVPHVNRIDYQLIDISEDGFVSLLTDSGGTKDDLKLPTDDNLSALIFGLEACLILIFGVELLMDEGRQKDLQLLEEIIDKGLKQKLLQTIASRPDTRHIFMDVGLGFYVEFTRQEALDYIPKREELVKKYDTALLFIPNAAFLKLCLSPLQALGLFYPQPCRIGVIILVEEVTKVIAQIKGRIKLAHHQIQQILNLPDENPSSHGQPVMDPAQNTSAAGIGGSNGTTTMGYQTNDGTATASEDSKENLNQVINSIQKTLGLLHQLHLTVSSFTPASQLHLLQRLNSLVSELNSMTKLSEKCNIQVPMEVLSLIDDGKNPDEFTRDVINSCVARNQVTKGKTDAFKDLRKHILEELEETFPDEVDKYREIRAASAAEAKRQAQSQSVLPNGDAKVKSEL